MGSQVPSYMRSIHVILTIGSWDLLLHTWSQVLSTGRLLHCQVEHHVRDKFATPILYGIDNFKIYDIFSTYT